MSSGTGATSKLKLQSFSRKITRICAPLIVARIGNNWDATAMQLETLIAPIVQTMVVVHNIAGIESY
jgi:hypothetical protein